MLNIDEIKTYIILVYTGDEAILILCESYDAHKEQLFPLSKLYFLNINVSNNPPFGLTLKLI
jgi:hypothetical protein